MQRYSDFLNWQNFLPEKSLFLELFFHAEQSEELVLAVNVLKLTTILECDGGGVLFLDAAHLHAHVLCLGIDDDSAVGEDSGEQFADVVGHAFLHLEASREGVDDACEFAQADDAACGDVADGHLAEEGQDVVFAQGVELNVLDDDDFASLVLKDGAVHDGVGVLAVAAGVLDECLGGAHGGLGETFAVRVFMG